MQCSPKIWSSLGLGQPKHIFWIPQSHTVTPYFIFSLHNFLCTTPPLCMHQSLAQNPIQFCRRIPRVQHHGPKSRLVAGQKTSSPAALWLRVKYSDFFQSAIHAISWNAECAESKRQLDDFSISTICWELPIVQRSGDNSNWPAILFCLPPKKCHILSLLLPTPDI